MSIVTTNFANITTNGEKVTTNGIYKKFGNYPLVLWVTTNGNKLEIALQLRPGCDSIEHGVRFRELCK